MKAYTCVVLIKEVASPGATVMGERRAPIKRAVHVPSLYIEMLIAGSRNERWHAT